MITSIATHLSTDPMAPYFLGKELREDSMKGAGSWTQALAARALFIAQVIVGLVAIPLQLLAIIIGPTLALCTEGKEDAFELLKEVTGHSILSVSAIPTALFAAFLPHSMKWKSPLKAVNNCVNDF